MRIGIDIDDTLTNTSAEIERHAIKYNSLYSNKLIDNIPNMLRGILEDEEVLDYFFKHIEEIHKGVQVKENAKEIIDKLHQEGHKIIFITARTKSFFKDPYAMTEEYLKRNNIYYDELIVGQSQKIKICKDKKIDIFFDDAVDTIEKLLTEKMDAVLFINKYNRDRKDLKSVSNWIEVYDYINNK